MTEARQWAERAAELAPQSEDPWLILAAVVSPRESVKYIRKALEVNPNSPRAKKGMEWAMQRLGETPKAGVSPDGGKQAQGGVLTRSESKEQCQRSEDVKNPKKRNLDSSHPVDPDGMCGLPLRRMVGCDIARACIHFKYCIHTAS